MSIIDVKSIETMEFAFKVARLLSAMETDDIIQTARDGVNILRILTVAPYGASAAQIASLNNRQDVSYTQAILNLLVKGGLIEENQPSIYTLKKGGFNI